MKRLWWVALKALLTVGLLLVVLHQVDLRALPATLSGMGVGAVLAAVFLTGGAVAVAAVRWHRVLRYLDERVTVRSLLGDTLVGTTYNLILPTSIGGDVARAYRCGRRAAQADHAWASVIYERVMGLLSLVLVSCVGILSTFSPGQQQLLLAASGMAVALALGIALAPAPFRLAARISRLGAKRAGESLQRVANAFAGPLARPAARVETFAWSLLYQLVALSVLVAAASGWDQPGIYHAIYLGVPIALVASTIPITIGGLGLRESLFVAVLQPFGVPADRAFALSMVWLASNLLVGIAGLVPLLVGERK